MVSEAKLLTWPAHVLLTLMHSSEPPVFIFWDLHGTGLQPDFSSCAVYTNGSHTPSMSC